MFNNLLIDAKAAAQQSIANQTSNVIQHIATDYYATGIALGAASYLVSPFILTVPAAALVILADKSQPLIIGSVIGYAATAVISKFACASIPVVINAAIAVAISHPVITLGVVATSYVIYSAQKVEALPIDDYPLSGGLNDNLIADLYI